MIGRSSFWIRSASCSNAPVAQLEKSTRLRSGRPGVRVLAGAPIMEGYAARAASGPENRDIHRKVRGSTPHPSASFFLMRGRGAVIRPLDCLISSRRSFKSALRNQHGEVTGAAIGGDCKSPGLAFAGSSPAFLTNTRVKDYGSRRVCHTCSRGSTPRIRTNSRRDSSAVERWSEKPRVGCSTHPLGTNWGKHRGAVDPCKIDAVGSSPTFSTKFLVVQR